MKIVCPKCNVEMSGTVEELRGGCPRCGYYTGATNKPTVTIRWEHEPDFQPIPIDEIMPKKRVCGPRKSNNQGDEYRAIRIAGGLTLAQMAARIKVSKVTLSRFELGGRTLSPFYAETLDRKYRELALESFNNKMFTR